MAAVVTMHLHNSVQGKQRRFFWFCFVFPSSPHRLWALHVSYVMGLNKKKAAGVCFAYTNDAQMMSVQMRPFWLPKKYSL